MSDIYVRRLGRLRDEYQAARGALVYALEYWQTQSLYNFHSLERSSRDEVRRAAENLESTFFIRAFSVFEGALKEHLEKNHPVVAVAEDVSAAWLIDRVGALQDPPIRDPLRPLVHQVRRYRNYLVHPGAGPMPPLVTFQDALSRLSRFLDRLPEPPY